MEYSRNKSMKKQAKTNDHNTNQTDLSLMTIGSSNNQLNHALNSINPINNYPSSISTSTTANNSIPLIKANQSKISFSYFYYYYSKMEIQIAELESLLFWTSFAEVFFFFLGISIYLSHPKTLDFLWVFIVHLIRAIIGFAFLRIFPHTFEAIESSQLSSTTQCSIEEIEALLLRLYKRLFSRRKSNIKVIFVIYCILTSICLSVNDFVLFSIFRSLCNGKYRLKNFLTIGFVMVYHICNGVYFSWFSTLRYTLPVLSSYMIKTFCNEIRTGFGLFKKKGKNAEELMANQSMTITIHRDRIGMGSSSSDMTKIVGVSVI